MLSFVKMHGLGNDFVIVDCRQTGVLPPAHAVRKIADRHRGVGFDQLVVLLPATNADLLLRFFNADGSEAGACGNATRCVAQLHFQQTGKDHAIFATQAGLLPVWRAGAGAAGEPLYAVDIAQPQWAWDRIPLATEQDTLQLALTVENLSQPCAVNVGNPHVVFFVPDVAAVDLARLGPQIEHHPLFPARTNVEICQVLSPQKLRMRVWERGAGITLACGSGAAATLVAAARRGLAERKAEIVLDGGSLWVEWRADDRVVLTGAASAVFAGTFDAQFLAELA